MNAWDLLFMAGEIGTPYYTNGTEDVAWVEGYATGSYTLEKLASYLRCEASDNTAIAEASFVTEVAVDLTNISTLYIDWENVGISSSYSVAAFIVSDTKAADLNVYTARLLKNNWTTRVIGSLDVSALTGSYYIRVHAKDNFSSITRNSDVRAYRIWGV